MHSERVYLALGSNLGDSIFILQRAFEEIQALPTISHFQRSQFYQTSPVSPIPQKDFINATCSFACELSPIELFQHLQAIEKKLGKVPKAKTAPRTIDIDILLYGHAWIDTPELKIPHHGLKGRLFVLTPLSDLTDHLLIPEPNGKLQRLVLKDYLSTFPNPNQERVSLYTLE